MKILIVSGALLFLFGCSDLPCMKSYQLHLKANMAGNAAEKAYYEKQAEPYDQQCANFNDQEFKKRQQEQLRKSK